VARAHSDVKWEVLTGDVKSSVAYGNGTKMKYKAANILV